MFGPESHRITPFGVVTTSADGLHVILRGPITAEMEGTDGALTLSGARALTWVDEILPESVHTVAVTASGGSRPSACPHTDLRGGVVPAGGFVLHRTAAEMLHDKVETHCAEAQPASRLSRPSASCRPARLGWRPRQSAPSAQSWNRRTARSTHWTGPYIIGRYPLGDDAVRNATASPIVVHNDNHVSRVHAYVSIDRGAVYVRDAFTTGGTFIAAPGAKDWTRIGTTPTELEPGWSLRVGERILTYHAGDRD